MGVSCKIFRSKNGEVEKVLAPNNSESYLYQRALEVSGNKDSALSIWATAYTPNFRKYYGYWDSSLNTESFDLDQNGEPLIRDVMKYLEMKTNRVGIFSPKEIIDIHSMLNSSAVSDFSELENIVSLNFVVDGEVVLNKYNLSKSGLYTNEEIERIISDEDVRRGVSNALGKIIDSGSYFLGAKEQRFFENSNSDLLVYKEGKYNSLGKREVYNPAEIDYLIMENAAGINDIEAFSSAIDNIGIEELSIAFNEDSTFRQMVFDRYSTMDVIPNVMIDENGRVTPYDRTLAELQNYSRVNIKALPEFSQTISDFLSLDDYSAYEDIYMSLKSVEKMAAEFGVDIVGLADVYDGSNKYYIDSLLMSLEIYISNIHRGEAVDVAELAREIDSALGRRGRYKAVVLPEGMRGMPVVYMESSMSEKDLFDRYSMIRVGDNIYMSLINSNESNDTLYTDLAEVVKNHPESFNYPIFPSSFYKDGILDYKKIKGISNIDILKDSIKQYIFSLSDGSNTERMNLSKMIYRLPVGDYKPTIDIQNEFNRYTEARNRNFHTPDIMDIRKNYLSNKVNNTELYQNVYKHMAFDSNGLTIRSNDIGLKNEIDLNLKGRDRELIYDYSLMSNNNRLSDLFYFDNNDISEAGVDFYHYLYTRNPFLLNNYSGTITESLDTFYAPGCYDSFIKSKGEILSKISESDNGSVYKNITELNPAAYMYSLTQELNTTSFSDTRVSVSPDIVSEYSISEKERLKLDGLEC